MQEVRAKQRFPNLICMMQPHAPEPTFLGTFCSCCSSPSQTPHFGRVGSKTERALSASAFFPAHAVLGSGATIPTGAGEAR